MAGRLTHAIVRTLDRAAAILGAAPRQPSHLLTGVRGEEEAYFHLRRLGYVMVARNFRSSRRKGEIDLVGWDSDTLCFIEVKTRRKRDFVPAEAAVDSAKQRELRIMAREYIHRVKPDVPWRFDVVSVYGERGVQPEISLIRDAFPIR
jgi:putative endonuclease